MQSRIIGRYRQSDGRIVRCDVEGEPRSSKPTQREAPLETSASDNRAAESSKDRSLAGNDHLGSMLML